MVKSLDEVVSDFNEIVNMTAEELDVFLKTEGSNTTGLSKDDGSGESIGHESGRRIVDILQRNPSKDPSKYTEDDKEHMRRVVSYCKRHLAQEGKLKETKGPEELEKTKSTRSLKNWGHDVMKTVEAVAKPVSKKAEKPVSKKAEKPVSKKVEKPTSKASAEKPVSKKVGKPASIPAADKPVSKKAEKPPSKAKPVSQKAEKPVEEKEVAKPASKAKPVSKAKKPEEAGTGEKRAVVEEKSEKPVSKKAKAAPEEEAEKPAPKKAKTAKPASEGTREPPSRGTKKA